MKEVKIYIFRHGQTTYNRDGRFTGTDNPNLTNLGIKQARLIANKLKNKKIGLAFHSRLNRSKDTLNAVLKYHPECQKTIEDDRIIERNYGKLNGSTHKSFINKIGKKLYNLEVQGDLITGLPPQARKEVEKFLGEQEFNLIHRGFYVPPPGGESFAMVEKRVLSFIKDLKKLIKKEKCNVIISAHGNSIRLFRKIMEKASIQETISWKIPYDDYYEYTLRV
jgi:2,3-bisphosphoglycerate-dependent phosphoglycerate mutase